VFPLGQPNVIKGKQYTTVSQLVFGFRVSQSTPVREESSSVSLRSLCVSESSSVSLRNKKSTVLAVNYRRRKPVFRRVAVLSRVRSSSVYLVVSCCVSSQ
jgi:hypothetical protein